MSKTEDCGVRVYESALNLHLGKFLSTENIYAERAIE